MSIVIPQPCKNTNCKNTTTYGRCRACQIYFRKHGEERPEERCNKMYYRTSEHRPRKCKVCKSPRVVAWGRCSACHVYWTRHEKPRPRYLWDKAFPCLTCGVPLGTLPVGKRYKGRCVLCQRYYLRYGGKERPQYLWGIGEYGWCACGMRADYLVAGTAKCSRCK